MPHEFRTIALVAMCCYPVIRAGTGGSMGFVRNVFVGGNSAGAGYRRSAGRMDADEQFNQTVPEVDPRTTKDHLEYVAAGNCPSIHSSKTWCNGSAQIQHQHWAPYEGLEGIIRYWFDEDEWVPRSEISRPDEMVDAMLEVLDEVGLVSLLRNAGAVRTAVVPVAVERSVLNERLRERLRVLGTT